MNDSVAMTSSHKVVSKATFSFSPKQPSSPQPVRATPNTLSRSASHDDSTVSGKVVSRAVFKTSSSDSQQVPPYATLPRTVKVETEVRKKHYDDIDEDLRFDSYDGRRSNEWNPDIISDVVRPPKKIELFRSEETISPSYTSHQTESSPPSTHFKAPGDVRGFTDKPQPVGRGGRRVPDESAHESYGVNPQLTSDSVGSEEDFDNHLANGDTSSSDLGSRHSSRPPAIVHLRKQKEVAAVQATQEPPPVKTTTTVPLVRQERMPSTEQYIPSEPDHGPSRVKIKKGGKWYKEIFKEMHSTAGASSNLSALLASDAHKHVPRDESSSPTFEDNEVFTKPLAYQYEEPIKSSYSTTVSSERVPSQGDSPTERKPSSPRQGGEMPVGRKVPSWYKELQRGDEVPVDKIEHPESYVVQSHKKQASYDSTEELRQYTPREYSHVSQPGMVRTYTPPPSHALDIRRPPASTQIDHIGKERRPNPVTVQQEERNQPPSASSLYESRFRRTGDRSRTGKEDRPSDEDVARRQRQEQARRHEEEARRREEEARRRKEEEERRRAEEEEMRRKQEEERKRKQMEEEKRRRKAEEEEARRKATQKPQFTAKALYSFQAQNPRELSFKKGDIMVVKRQIDKNWIEGEINGQTGIFPTNYVELRPVEDEEEEEIVAPMQATQVHAAPSPATSPVPVPTSVSSPAPSHAQLPGPVEGEARARYTFKAEGQRELPCSKGDILTLTRRIDKNWYDARLKGRSGIIPASYIEVLREPGTAQKGIPQQQQSRSTESPAQEQAKEVINLAYRPQEQAKEVINSAYRPQEQAKEVVNSAYRPQEQAKEVISSAYRPQEQTKEVVNSAYRPQDQEKEVINVAYRPQEQAKEIVNSAYRQPEQLVARQDPRIQEPSRQEQEIISRKPTSTAYQENNNDYKQDFVDASPTSHTVGSPPRTTQVKYIEEVPDVTDPYPSQPIIEYDDRTVLPLQGERYKAVFSYDPMNEDELQLDEGDVVIVLEKCDDGWFVGTSTKTGMFGTFPGNYVVPC